MYRYAIKIDLQRALSINNFEKKNVIQSDQVLGPNNILWLYDVFQLNIKNMFVIKTYYLQLQKICKNYVCIKKNY